MPTKFSGVCVQGQSGGFGAPGVVVPPSVGPPSANVVNNPNGFGSVNGIPCTPEHMGTCIGPPAEPGRLATDGADRLLDAVEEVVVAKGTA